MKDKIKEVMQRLYPNIKLPCLFWGEKELTYNTVWFLIKKEWDEEKDGIKFESYESDYCLDKKAIREKLNANDGILLFYIDGNTGIQYVATKQCQTEIDLYGGMKKYLEL